MGMETLLRILRPKDSVRQIDAASILLETEIEQCLSYFERTESEARERGIKAAIEEATGNGKPLPVAPEFLKEPVRLESIHGGNYTVGRLGTGYFWEAEDNVRHRIGNGVIPADMIQAVQNITVPYALHVKSRENKA
jgi:hypothetical protein